MGDWVSSVGTVTCYDPAGPCDLISKQGEISHARPDRPWGPPTLLYNTYRLFPGDKTVGAWCWPPNSSVPGSCEWSGAITPPPFSACTDMRWGHLYLYRQHGVTQYNRVLALCSHAGIGTAAGHQVIKQSRIRSDNRLCKRHLKCSSGDRNSEVQPASGRRSPDTAKSVHCNKERRNWKKEFHQNWWCTKVSM
jgi:hypothetical protein